MEPTSGAAGLELSTRRAIESRWPVLMIWHDLLFMHWPVSVAALRALIPPPLELDLFDGQAWLGVVPFRMSGVGPRFLNRIPGASAFAELNVRTYVSFKGRPGVWFFSLDAANRLAVWAARRSFFLPYYYAQMSLQHDGEWIDYHSTRAHRGARPATFAARYRPTGSVQESSPASLDHWLTSRYALYSADRRGRIFRGDIDHAPWPLQRAECEFDSLRMTEQIGVVLPDTAPLLHFARKLDVVAAQLKLVSG